MGKKLVLVVSSEKDKQQLYGRNVQILIRGTFIWQFKCTCHTFASVATKTLSAAVCRQAWSYFWRPPILLGQHANISLRSALYVASTVDMQTLRIHECASFVGSRASLANGAFDSGVSAWSAHPDMLPARPSVANPNYPGFGGS